MHRSRKAMRLSTARENKAATRVCAGCDRKVWYIGRFCSICQVKSKADRAVKRLEKGYTARTPKERPGDNPQHRAWIRTLPCSVVGCRGPSVCAHVRQNTGGGTGIKPHDRWTVPLCDNHHKEQHAIGHVSFDRKHGIDLRAIAIRLADISPVITQLAPVRLERAR